MTNFERFTKCETPEEFTYVFMRLQQYAIYANGRLLDSSPNDFMEWLNKETDELDIDIVFNSNIKPCHRCEYIPELKNEYGEMFYQCPNCNLRAKNEDNNGNKMESRSELEARLIWNY